MPHVIEAILKVANHKPQAYIPLNYRFTPLPKSYVIPSTILPQPPVFSKELETEPKNSNPEKVSNNSKEESLIGSEKRNPTETVEEIANQQETKRVETNDLQSKSEELQLLEQILGIVKQEQQKNKQFRQKMVSLFEQLKRQTFIQEAKNKKKGKQAGNSPPSSQ